MSASSVLKVMKDKEIEYVDLRFTDPRGKLQHVTMDATIVDDSMLNDGVFFDGSSIAGWKAINESDMVIGSVYVVGKEAPKVVSRDMLKSMNPGTVMVDVSIDQGGCFESSRPTTHDNPTFLENEIVHYCVTNMPGAVPLTATQALNKVTLSYIQDLANKGVENALNDDEHLRNGLNIQNGEITHPAVKDALNN